MIMQPTVIVLGGPNGAGKTTFARQLMLSHLPDSFEFLNADMIADGISPFRPHKAAMRAGREFLKRFEEKASKRESIVVESTLSGLALADRLSGLKDQGYFVEIVYLWLPDADFALRRVAERVKRGGHNIPEEIVRRRFNRSYPNFETTYRKIADLWTILDGSVTPPKEIVRATRGGPLEVFDRNRYDEMELNIDGPSTSSGSTTGSFEDGVSESPVGYGREVKYYLDDLAPVLDRVGQYLEELAALNSAELTTGGLG